MYLTLCSDCSSHISGSSLFIAHPKALVFSSSRNQSNIQLLCVNIASVTDKQIDVITQSLMNRIFMISVFHL